MAIIREMGVECGGSNVQMAINPADGEARLHPEDLKDLQCRTTMEPGFISALWLAFCIFACPAFLPVQQCCMLKDGNRHRSSLPGG